MNARRLLVGLLLVALAWAAWTAGRPGELDRPALEARAGRAASLYDEGRYGEAAAIYLVVAAEAEDGDAADLALGWHAQAGVCLKMAGELERAREQLEPVMETARAAGDDQALGLALGNLARVAGLQGRLAEAREHQDELAELALRNDDGVLEVKALEQAADTSLRLDDLVGAAERLRRAEERDAANPETERRGDALVRQLAWVAARSGDDEGAAAEWRRASPSGAAMANQSRHLTELGLHPEAAEAARAAVHLFEAEGDSRRTERDRALFLEASALLRARDLRACRELIDGILAGGGDAVALAPFEILKAREAMALEEWDSALQLMDAVAPAAAEIEDARFLPWLRAATLVYAARHDEARAVLLDAASARDGPVGRDGSGASDPPDEDAPPFDLPTAMLLAWSLATEPPADPARASRLSVDILLSLRPDPDRPLDRAVAELRDLCPQPLPSLAFVTLDLHVAEAGRRREAGDAAAAAALVRSGVREALVWQAMEAIALVTPGAPAVGGPDQAAALARLDSWVAGELPPDQAIVAVIVGNARSYLALCTGERGATTLGVPPRFALRNATTSVTQALHADDEALLVDGCHRLFAWIFSDRAREDLGARTRWTMILPDELTSVPPAMWLPEEPVAGTPPDWLVLTHVISLLPHALVAGEPSGTAGSTTGGTGDTAAGNRAAGDGWAQIESPTIDLASMPLSTRWLAARYGAPALQPRPAASLDVAERWSGAEATVGKLRGACALADVLQLAVPGLGGGRLAGLYFSPLPAGERDPTSYGDEALGFFPWHRFAEIELPPTLVLDQTRFDPDDIEHGAAYAATAMLRHARSVVVTRWPLPRAPAEIELELLSQALRSGLACGPALTAAQRAYLLQARADGNTAALAPRAWAAWLAFSAD